MCRGQKYRKKARMKTKLQERIKKVKRLKGGRMLQSEKRATRTKLLIQHEHFRQG